MSANRPERDPRRRYEVSVVRDVRIPTGDPAITLSADLFLPVDAGPVPALVTVLPYRKDAWAGLLNRDNLHGFAAHGYAGLLVDLRGTGSSDGEQRAPFHPDEADDGVAAVEWAATQPWCDGGVGMWGHSYGAVMALRTAARGASHLKAIVPVMGMLDPERDFVHPDGRRGCLSSLGVWGMHTLLTQLLPPMDDAAGLAEQRRWQGRLDRTEPYLVDLFRHGPGHPVWRARAIDASRITVPAFCIGGWQDLFCAATIRAYEQINGPKRLLVGPWTHTMPDAAPFAAADFIALALPWWDRWLRGVDNEVDTEPSVVLFVQGGAAHWRRYGSWPPGKTAARFTTGPRTTRLRATPDDDGEPRRRWAAPTAVIAEHRSDPTAGALGALWGVPSRGLDHPLDQHDDDMRSLIVTTDRMAADMLIVGSPVVHATAVSDGGRPNQFIVKLADVDPTGRSTLITCGSGAEPGPEPVGISGAPLVLAPTCYLVQAGHRLRVAINGADFPRLWPESRADGDLIRLTRVRICLPTVPDDEGTATLVPPPYPGEVGRPPVILHERSRWVVTRDFVSDGVEVLLGEELTARTGRHLLEVNREISARVTPASTATARLGGESTAMVRMASGETVTVRAEFTLTEAALQATGEVSVDGVAVCSQRWVSRPR